MHALLKDIDALPTLRRFGRVARIEGLLVEVTGAAGAISLGGQVTVSCGNGKRISCEAVGFRNGHALALPLGDLDGVTLGARADFEDRPTVIIPRWAGSDGSLMAWAGRVTARVRCPSAWPPIR